MTTNTRHFPDPRTRRDQAMTEDHAADYDAPQRVTIYPREAAALDRLLDAYIATDEGDPGREDLARFRGRVRRIRQDHTAYTRVTPPVVGQGWTALLVAGIGLVLVLTVPQGAPDVPPPPPRDHALRRDPVWMRVLAWLSDRFVR